MKKQEKSLQLVLENKKNLSNQSGIIHWWIFSGEMTREKIISELDYVCGLGIKQVLIAAGYNVSPKYLSNEWFELVKLAVGEAKKRGIKVWIADEGTYPTGFAGDTFNKKYPHLRMKAIVVEKEFNINENSIEINPHPRMIGILAKDVVNGKSVAFDKQEFNTGLLTLPYSSNWQIKVISWDYRTSPTRYVHHPTGAKDTTYSLCDYLSFNAVNMFINEVHEKYKTYIGDEFGKTVIGFLQMNLTILLLEFLSLLIFLIRFTNRRDTGLKSIFLCFLTTN